VKDYTLEHLAENNGEEGRPAYVAVDGKVYDVSSSKRWPLGNHMKRHQAGADLSTDIQAAPHGPEVLDRFETIGRLARVPKEPVSKLKGKVDAWLANHPFFRRHPHPAVVHIPVGMFFVLPLFQIVALVFHVHAYATEWAAVCCLIMGTAAIPVAIATGYFTWWMNYDLSDSPIIAMKRRCAWIALPLAALALVFRWIAVKDPVAVGNVITMLYSFWIFVLALIVGYIGFLGGTLTFPYQSKK
jgi:predicted heme/steroid binding protein/uncharacterized membrane protein